MDTYDCLAKHWQPYISTIYIRFNFFFYDDLTTEFGEKMIPLQNLCLLLCCFSVVSSFNVNGPTWKKNLTNKQHASFTSQQRRLSLQKSSGLSMTLNPQVLKTGIATYGIIIGAGGIIAGNYENPHNF